MNLPPETTPRPSSACKVQASRHAWWGFKRRLTNPPGNTAPFTIIFPARLLSVRRMAMPERGEDCCARFVVVCPRLSALLGFAAPSCRRVSDPAAERTRGVTSTRPAPRLHDTPFRPASVPAPPVSAQAQLNILVDTTTHTIPACSWRLPSASSPRP